MANVRDALLPARSEGAREAAQLLEPARCRGKVGALAARAAPRGGRCAGRSGRLPAGEQWALQGRLASEESVSREMFATALKLAAHRDLLAPTAPLLGKRRHDFADESRRSRLSTGFGLDRAHQRTGCQVRIDFHTLGILTLSEFRRALRGRACSVAVEAGPRRAREE